MDEFEKIKTFSESLEKRQQKISESNEENEGNNEESRPDLPAYLSQFRAVPQEEPKESRFLLWIVLILCCLVFIGVAVALTNRLPEMESSEIAVISPTPVPVKVRPEQPGGLKIPDTDKVVYNRATELAPAPVEENLFVDAEQPVLPQEFIEPEEKEEALVSLNAPAVDPVVSEESVITAPEDAVVVSEEVSSEGIPEETPQELSAVVAPVVEPVKIPDAPKKVEEKTVPAEKSAASAPATGKWRAQLLSSSSKAKVESSWKTISKKHASLLSNMPYQIVSATIPGKGTFWRLQVGEFANKDLVVNLCAKLKKKKQDCIPVK